MDTTIQGRCTTDSRSSADAPFKMSDRVETFVTQDALYDRGEGRGCLSLQQAGSHSNDGSHLLHGQDLGRLHQRWWLGRSEASARCGEIPICSPDAEVTETVPFNMPLIYRLMGDWHQQHIDWAYRPEQTGLARPIVHGVSLGGFAMRHLISTWFPGQPETHDALQDAHHFPGHTRSNAHDTHVARR